MNQVIGIEFQAKNHSQVIKAIRSMARTVGALVSQIQAMNSGLAKIGVAAFPASLAPQVAALSEMTAAVAALNAQTKQFRGIRGPIVSPQSGPFVGGHGDTRRTSGPQSTHRAEGTGLPFALGAVPFALRWGLTGGLIYGGLHAGKQTVLGGARQEVAPRRRDLSVLGFGKEEIDRIEKWADNFLKDFWVGGDKKGMLDAVTEMGSAFDPRDNPYMRWTKDPAGLLTKMTEAGVALGAASKMSAEAGNELLSSALQSQLAFMPKDILEQYKSGTRDIGEFAQETAAKIAGAIKVTAVWGKEIQQSFAYSLPGALQKGWKLETLLAYTGMMKTAGIPAARAGRAMRMFLEKGPEDMAYMMLGGSEDPATREKFLGMKESERKKWAKSESKRVEQEFNADPFGYGRKIGQSLQRMEALSDKRLAEVLDSDFTQIFRAFTSDEMTRRMEEVVKSILDLTFDKLKEALKAESIDTGWFLPRIKNTMDTFLQALSKVGGEDKMVQEWFRAMLQPFYTMADMATGNKKLGHLMLDIVDLVGNTVYSTIRSVYGAALNQVNDILISTVGVKLQMIPTYEELKLALGNTVSRIFNWFKDFIKNIASVLPINPFKSEWLLPGHTTPQALKDAGAAINKLGPENTKEFLNKFGGPSSGKTPAYKRTQLYKWLYGEDQVSANTNGGTVNVQIAPQTDTIKIDTTLNIGAEQLARLQAEAERLRNSKNGVSFGNDLNQGVIMP